jgi:PAS domain S-box-containing protein
MTVGTDLLEALPVAVYTTDAEGRITFYNAAAAELWGCRPELGSAKWCGSWRLYWPDGRPMRHDECPMAVCLREGRPIRGVEVLAERPDGTRVAFVPYPTPLRDETGRLTGAINLLVDIQARKSAEIAAARLAAIVEGSDDAIVSKTLEGVITSWNAGAARIFGYGAAEMIGQPILKIIPAELRSEEADILAKLKRGERIEHFDTVRVAKDGRRVNVSLTVSPLRDGEGRIIGASKIARDFTERKQREELQRLLFEELNHRVKNTLATIQAIANMSLRRTPSPAEFVASFNGRVQALARAHDLLVHVNMKGAPVSDIVREQVVLGSTDGTRIAWSGPRVMLDARSAVQLALVLHELATNARKYGALSVPAGRLAIGWTLALQPERELRLDWRESGVANLRAPRTSGFGTTLVERTLESCGGQAEIQYGADGVCCHIRLPLPVDDQDSFIARIRSEARDEPILPVDDDLRPDLRGRRILVVEDEALVAMDVAAQLEAAGCVVIGPAGTVARARELIEQQPADAAIVDANLGGQPVDEIAAALTQKGVPFAFGTGYGRSALPCGFQDAPMLTKPFGREQLLSVIAELLAGAGDRPGVVSMRQKRG